MLNSFFGIEEEIKEEVEEVQTKPLSFFDYLSDINYGKTGTIHVERDPDLKQFNTFMILRYLSLEKGFVSLVNILNVYQAALTKEEMYKVLLFLIPRGRRFLQYPKAIKDGFDEESIELVRQYFECSFEEAKEWVKLKLISTYDVEKIKEAFGGKVNKKRGKNK